MAIVPPRRPMTAEVTTELLSNKAPPTPPRVPKTEPWSNRTCFRLYLDQNIERILFSLREEILVNQKSKVSLEAINRQKLPPTLSELTYHWYLLCLDFTKMIEKINQVAAYFS